MSNNSNRIEIVPIHTSDRGLFKTCRRRWVWGSHLNYGLEPVTKAAPLWFGEAIHFALKEFHGPRNYPTIEDAFLDYARLSEATFPDRLPTEFPELLTLGKGMLDHYMHWLERRELLDTYILNGVPQVEVTFEIDLTPHLNPQILERAEIERVAYRGTFDRISIDPQTGLLYIVEYKTAKVMSQAHLMVDAQVSAYMWAASCVYDLPIGGVIYQQHKKAVPKPARILQSGLVSAAANQATVHRLYKQALIDVYGDVRLATPKHIEVLNGLAQAESYEADPFIVRTRVHRNEHQISVEGARILLEVEEMLDPDTPMYPHQSLHCTMCPFMSPCASMDDGSDFESELFDERFYRRRLKASSEWELLSTEKLGGVLYHAQARIQHDRAGLATTSKQQQQCTGNTEDCGWSSTSGSSESADIYSPAYYQSET